MFIKPNIVITTARINPFHSITPAISQFFKTTLVSIKMSVVSLQAPYILPYQ